MSVTKIASMLAKATEQRPRRRCPPRPAHRAGRFARDPAEFALPAPHLTLIRGGHRDTNNQESTS